MSEKDVVEKTLESYNDVFADIVNVLLFQGKQVIHEDELEDAQPRSYYKADGKIREQERDVSKYWRKSEIQIALLGIENQTRSDADMPIRMIGYDGAAYRNQMKKESTERYPVVTLVLYFDYKKHWDKSLHLRDCFDIPVELKPYVNDYHVNLFEIAFLSEEQVDMFQSDFKIVADYFVQMRKHDDYIPSRETIRHVEEVLQLMAVMNEDTRFEEAYFEEGRETNMCEYLDRLIERGEKRGLEIGEIRGTIDTCRDFGASDKEIVSKLMERFRLSEEDARKHLEETTSQTPDVEDAVQECPKDHQ